VTAGSARTLIMPAPNIVRKSTHTSSHITTTDGRVVLFFYFDDADTGLLMLIPGIRGQMEVARFHLKGGLPDPQWN